MKRPFSHWTAAIAILGVLFWAGKAVAAPGFTYQGRMTDGGAPARANYEMSFRLFDALSGGTQVGSTITLPSVAVTNGFYTVELDFGVSAFDGSNRWLEQALRPSGSVVTSQTLAPRQKITAVPYALRSFAGSGNAADLTTGTIPDARLSDAIARSADLSSLSNALSSRIAALEVTISNQAKLLPPAGVAAVSANLADSTLTAQGWVPFSSIPAPPWVNGSATGAPSARSGNSAVWTGQVWMLWGGKLGNGFLSAVGAEYDPAADHWTPTSQLNSPTARYRHSAVWTGTDMVIWGGSAVSGTLASGASLSLSTGNWTALTSVGAPAARDQHVAVWTGTRMLVWGGSNPSGLLNDGYLLDPNPAAQTWSGLPTSGAPEARQGATAVWTGTKLVVWGGGGALGDLNSGGVLPLASGQTPGVWSATQTANAPSVRSGHSMVWTGSKVLVWGGDQAGSPLNTGAAYDPEANTWVVLPTTGAPSARTGHVAVWTGSEMLIFGGLTASGEVATGAAYNPVTATWRPLSSTGSPLARTEASGVWTGSEFLIFGGTSGGSPVASLQRLNPQPTWYFYRKP